MLFPRHRIIIALFAALAAFGGYSGTAQSASTAKLRKAPPARTCQQASAVATGFGVENATTFASGNLDLAIDKAKDQLAGKGAKGFSIKDRKVSCSDYIDFGGALGREQKCQATALVCGQAG